MVGTLIHVVAYVSRKYIITAHLFIIELKVRSFDCIGNTILVSLTDELE